MRWVNIATCAKCKRTVLCGTKYGIRRCADCWGVRVQSTREYLCRAGAALPEESEEVSNAVKLHEERR